MSRPHGSASALEQRLRHVVEAVQAADREEDVAPIIGVNPRSIYRWLDVAAQPDGIAAKPHPALATRLSPAQQQQLKQMLRQGAQARGWSNQLRTTRRITDVKRKLMESTHVPVAIMPGEWAFPAPTKVMRMASVSRKRASSTGERALSRTGLITET